MDSLQIWRCFNIQNNIKIFSAVTPNNLNLVHRYDNILLLFLLFLYLYIRVVVRVYVVCTAYSFLFTLYIIYYIQLYIHTYIYNYIRVLNFFVVDLPPSNLYPKDLQPLESALLQALEAWKGWWERVAPAL